MKRVAIIISGLIFILVSCTDHESMNIFNEENEQISNLTTEDEKLYLKTEFSKALSKTLEESSELRRIIKEEALKKINHDYDVIYQFIKDKQLSNGETIKEYLGKYMSSTNLDLIDEKIPTLTIFVPSLPENSFSAESWNTDNEIPVVGIRTNKIEGIPMFDSTGEQWTLKYECIPAFPVVVIKENERIVANIGSFSSSLTKGLSHEIDNNIAFSFIDEAFNNIDNKNITKATPAVQYTGSGTQNDPYIHKGISKIFDAYNVYKNIDGWQRDYIYYNITSTQNRGPFNYKFSEHLVGFELLGNPMTTLGKISDQPGDPTFITPTGSVTDRTAFWTDGEFEFKVKMYIGNKAGYGNELIKHFRCSPQDLFEVNYRTVTENNRQVKYFDKLTFKKAFISLPLFEWDLETYSAAVKINIEEVDATQTIVQTTTNSSEFATNFDFDTSFGSKVKIGMKFGASQKEVRTISYQVSTTAGNDELGETVINFADPILTSDQTDIRVVVIGSNRSQNFEYYAEPRYTTKYYNGFYRIYVSPVSTY